MDVCGTLTILLGTILGMDVVGYGMVAWIVWEPWSGVAMGGMVWYGGMGYGMDGGMDGGMDVDAMEGGILYGMDGTEGGMRAGMAPGAMVA